MRAGVTMLAFGTLAIQVRKLVPSNPMDPATNITVEQRQGPWERLALQVWPLPPVPVQWPADMGINGVVGLETLADRFAPPARCPQESGGIA
jgi:hypothetical protein